MEIYAKAKEIEFSNPSQRNEITKSSFVDFAQSCKKEIKNGTMMYALPEKDVWMPLADLFDYWENI